jgi:branched-chain amino acid transport system permease protein
VLDRLTLAVDAREAVGVIGPNGAGKTTALNVMAGRLRPDRGAVIFDGRDVTALPAHARCRAGIALTHQIPHPFEAMTVFENVLVGATHGGGRPEREAYADCLVTLAQTGLAARANARAGAQRLVLNRLLGRGILPAVLVTFGLSVVIQNGLLETFSADSHRLNAGGLETASLPLGGGIAVGWFPLLTFAVAVLLLVGLQLLIGRTALGRAFRAASDDGETAELMGIDNGRLYGLAMALSLAIVAVAGVFLGIRTTFTFASGPDRLLFAFESVIIGGLGSLWGTLVGGVILGIAQTTGARFSPGWGVLAGHLVFLAVLVLRPSGLFAKSRRGDS